MSKGWWQKSAKEIVESVKKKEVSPVEIVEDFLGRLYEVDKKLDAFTQIWEGYAIQKARELEDKIVKGESLGKLAGVPVSIKEVICTREGFTTCASKILAGYRSPFDATVIEKMRQEDAVFIGKVNMDEFAMGSSTENSGLKLTRNPWNLECVPGGSSGGSASAVAGRECVISLGSDTGGSIRQPASFCGCVGLKPTYGRVSRYGLVAFASSLDQIGPLANSVYDCALAFEVIAGKDPKDSTSVDLPLGDILIQLESLKDLEGIRVGLPKEYFSGGLNEEVKKLVFNVVEVLKRQGSEVVEISLPHTEYAVATYYIICTAEASANLARFDGVRYGFRHPEVEDVIEMYKKSRSEGFGPEVQRRILLGTYVLSSGYYDAYYLKAQKVRRLITKDFEEAFKVCDIIVTPTSPTPAFRFGEKTKNPLEMYLSDIYTISVNLSALPAISVPCGFTKDGLPIGVQFIGKHFDEVTLLKVAHSYEINRGFNVGVPPV
ncbi:MAG: Asp-tRNA(Asn)/Glu-tRNA(Gln) amidotransferase subunit GatA [Candidatus Hydrogenedentes bacterium]|nr:Asp-tRNA(Asn)/Glu-tRNA(Gln) amidotransferase subunit GatA [Candidatus Hydrogenedentota bacterium]